MKNLSCPNRFSSLLLSMVTLIFTCEVALAAQIAIRWDPNVESDLAGYRVHYGTTSGPPYSTTIDVGNVTSYTLTSLSAGQTYFIAVTAYDTSYNQSGYSSEVSGSPSGSLAITPAGGLSSSGTQGGPFSPSSQAYTLQNTGGSSISWSAFKGQPWVSLSSSSGTLAAGASTAVTVSINSGASSLGPGSYSDVVSFINLTNGAGSGSRGVDLIVSGVPQWNFTIATNPPGLRVTVDTEEYVAPVTFNWGPGSFHILSVSSPQSGGTGIRYVFDSWSDGGSQTHVIMAPSPSGSYTANFTTQYSLTTSVNPADAGTVNPPGTSWHNIGQSVSVSASANSGYSFIGWAGDLSGSTNPSSVLMSGPKTLIVDFLPTQSTPNLTNLVFAISGADNGGAAVQFGENTFAGHGISLELGMFEIEGRYMINPNDGRVDGTYTLNDFDSVVVEHGDFSGQTDSKLAAMTLRLSRADGQPLFDMSGGNFVDEPVVPVDWNAKFSGSPKGVFERLKIQPFQAGGYMYSHVFKISGAGSIPSLGPIDLEGYFFFTNRKGKNAYGFYETTGAISETGVFSGKMNPVSEKFKFSLTSDTGEKRTLRGQSAMGAP